MKHLILYSVTIYIIKGKNTANTLNFWSVAHYIFRKFKNYTLNIHIMTSNPST